MEDKFVMANNGQALTIDDAQAISLVAAKADDRVLAQLLGVAPYNGSAIARRVMPARFDTTAAGSGYPRILSPSATANGKVVVCPFRAIIGSTAQTTSPDTDARDEWRGITSGLFAQNTLSAGNFGYELSLAANGSGNPRWDTIYATITPDTNGPTVVRKVKPPTGTGAPSPTNTVVTKYVAVTVAAVTGTPHASAPTLPSVPADPVGGYNVLIGHVRVATGFGGSSSVAAADIYEASTVAAVEGMRPVTAQNVVIPAAQTTAFNTWGTGGARPESFLPGTMVGGEERILLIDLKTPFHASLQLIDDTVDWRNRYFKTSVTGTNGSSQRFASSNPSAANTFPGVQTCVEQFGQSFVEDATFVASTRTAMSHDNGTVSAIASGGAVGLYVDAAGALRLYASSGTPPACRLMIWLKATAQMGNF